MVVERRPGLLASITLAYHVTYKRKLKEMHTVAKCKAYRPNAHLLYIVMHYNGSII